MAFELPPLPYDYSALEPYIDTATMHYHHDNHHGTYVTNVNNAIKGTEFDSWSIEQLLTNLDKLPDAIRTAVRNNGGGHYNHTMFWEIMAPAGTSAGPQRCPGRGHQPRFRFAGGAQGGGQ
ncbi:MAG: hypothetical protein KatS3mg059_1182 [Thermomicrobiales bacterium]|nr:MAG: hypothetical protein KatS3mg059_1182 [Thermomicrobiales bacterium]